MNPKQKAEELIEKFDVIRYMDLSGDRKLPVSMHRSQVVGCAIKAVEEILAEDYIIHSVHSHLSRNEYWQRVKEELEKL